MAGTVLVTGATGNTGAPLVDLLVRRGVQVRATVRSERDLARFAGAGVEAVVADFDDAGSIAAALDGVERTYLVTPSSERAQEQQERFVDLAAEAGVAQIVKLSQLAADEDSPVRFLRYHAAVERRIRERRIGFAFLRPNLFFQGLLAMAGPIREQGRFFAPIGDVPISAVDVRDIAAVAATALTEPGHDAAVHTITGPDAVTHAQIATAISAAVGRTVTFVDVDPESFAASLRGVLPDWQVDGLVEDYAHYARGEAADVTTTVSDVTGYSPRSVTGFATDHAAAFTALEPAAP
ncbi:uncharacterized protein YbjT (DUF2867 family) [Pseudonocardia sediminis]|uniref:Uncharacterized protein YbjT (DUF2867 family) n=1 Tax=Pseudonocardia sediminis TaxID=1397368 RepID=A0A4Q7URU0_PSEST|nr:SDR family oxidoreductase [Pseudonocardia sediminis]RZT83431.1 uncharacterized protein YbjT (DUF2867 family) [Pseudonocardia sediminis]